MFLLDVCAVNFKSWIYFKKIRKPITSDLPGKVDYYI